MSAIEQLEQQEEIRGTEIQIYDLHEGQQRVLRRSRKFRFNAICCGRRWGKTVLLVFLAASYAVRMFPSKFAGRDENGKKVQRYKPGVVGIFTPERKQWRDIYTALYELLKPIIKTSNRQEGVIELIHGGMIYFFQCQDELVGRGKFYHLVLIDEAAFTKAPLMLDHIWPRAIKPALRDEDGDCYVFSTPNGLDEYNFFSAICHDKSLGFRFHHAPSIQNPIFRASDLETERLTNDIRVYEQEYLAKFINWTRESFLAYKCLLEPVYREVADIPGDEFVINGLPVLKEVRPVEVDRVPVNMPQSLDAVYAVLDSGLKGGNEHDGHGFVYFGIVEKGKKINGRWWPRVWVLDWEITTFTMDLFEASLEATFTRGLELANQCGAMYGFTGLHVEPAGVGEFVIQRARAGTLDVGRHTGQPYAQVFPIPEEYKAKGKDGRALMVREYHYSELVRIVSAADNKVQRFKGQNKNHFKSQIGTYKLADKEAHKREDDIFDGYCYGLLLAYEARLNKLKKA